MAGNVVNWTNRRGQIIAFAYDRADQVTSKDYDTTPGVTDYIYTYDAAGNLTSATDSTGTTGYTYGNAMAGDHQFTFHILTGDFDGNAVVAAPDIDALFANFGGRGHVVGLAAPIAGGPARANPSIVPSGRIVLSKVLGEYSEAGMLNKAPLRSALLKSVLHICTPTKFALVRSAPASEVSDRCDSP